MKAVPDGKGPCGRNTGAFGGNTLRGPGLFTVSFSAFNLQPAQPPQPPPPVSRALCDLSFAMRSSLLLLTSAGILWAQADIGRLRPLFEANLIAPEVVQYQLQHHLKVERVDTLERLRRFCLYSTALPGVSTPFQKFAHPLRSAPTSGRSLPELRSSRVTNFQAPACSGQLPG